MSIRLRLTVWHTVLLALILLGFASLVYVAVARQLATELEYDIQLRALQASRTLRAVSRAGLNSTVRPVDLPSSAAIADEDLYVQVVGPNGEIIATSANLPELLPVPPESMRLAFSGQEKHDTLNFRGERIELYSAPLSVNGQVVAVLVVGAPLQPLESSLIQLRVLLAIVVVGTILLAALFGWFLASRAMRPVDRMTRTARSIGRSADFSRRLQEPQQRDELGRLASTFNEMLGQLDQAFSTQQRFLADASHELRTPLAVIRTNVESLRRGRASPTEQEESLEAIARETYRMGRMVDDLLALARADAGQPLVRRPLALDTILLEVYQQERRLADGVQLELGELEQVEVDGDADRLKQLLLNLVDNALRYTPPGGLVTLDLLHQGSFAVLRVRDTGPGIPAEHLPRIFERFYRVDEPRSRHAGGTGLGLAICRLVAEAHDGHIEVASEEGVGTTFTVYLPAKGGAERPAAEGALAPSLALHPKGGDLAPAPRV